MSVKGNKHVDLLSTSLFYTTVVEHNQEPDTLYLSGNQRRGPTVQEDIGSETCREPFRHYTRLVIKILEVLFLSS